MVSWNTASEGLAYIWQSKWVAIIAITIKTNRTQIHFLSDVLVGVTLDLQVPIITAKQHKGKNWSFLLLCFCRSVVMFRLCKVETSANNLRHKDITKNQSERLKNYRSLSLSGTIFNMAASGEDVVGRDVKVHVDIWQLLTETLRVSYTTKPSRPQNKE